MRSLESTQVARHLQATTGALWTAIHVFDYIRLGAGSQRDPHCRVPRVWILRCGTPSAQLFGLIADSSSLISLIAVHKNALRCLAVRPLSALSLAPEGSTEVRLTHSRHCPPHLCSTT